MKRFTIIRNNFERPSLFLDLFKGMIGPRIQVEEYETYLILYYEYESLEDIHSIFLSIATELMIDIVAYTSYYEDKKQKEELRIAKTWIKELKNGSYDLKKALLETGNCLYKKEILNLILDGTGIDEEFIRKFAEADLNVTKASQTMFAHRNTISYKLDRFYEISGFDLRKFQDCYMLYQLIVVK